jgi:sigma-B regulation protein RsbU (phosphoserine phosphatase)
MADVTDAFLHDQLLARRKKIESTISVLSQSEAASLTQLLGEVDSALERMEAGNFGICEICHDPIEKDRLIADPLIRYCLDHLTQDQRRALEQDLELAAGIQRELLPKQDFRYDGWEASFHYQPLGPVSGDYCDIAIPENEAGNLFFLLGDAAGKGIAASLLMTHLHAIFRTLISSGLPLPQMVKRAGRVFRETTMSNLFATLVCGKATRSGEVEICNAGHCPALVIRKGSLGRIESTGVPLGLFSEVEYSVEKVRLEPGETLFLYTDGVSEARSKGQEEYGEVRLVEVLSRCHSLTPQGLIRACLEDLAAFRSGVPLTDDLTMLAIRRQA